MRSRKRLLQIALWNVIQKTVRKTKYNNVSKALYSICNRVEKEEIIDDISDLDESVIESLLSGIAQNLDI